MHYGEIISGLSSPVLKKYSTKSMRKLGVLLGLPSIGLVFIFLSMFYIASTPARQPIRKRTQEKQLCENSKQVSF